MTRASRRGELTAALPLGFLLLSGCGVKGPPRPPLPRAPEAVRGFEVRQVGPSVEVRWTAPRRRQDGGPFDSSSLTYEILARALERPPALAAAAAPGPSPAAPPAGGPPPASPGTSSPSGFAMSGPRLSASKGLATAEERPDEGAFLKAAAVVYRLSGDGGRPDTSGSRPGPSSGGGPNAAAGEFVVALAPARFPGTRLATARLALSVVAVDGKGRRSPPRPILEIDPADPPLPPPAVFTAVPSAEGVSLNWKLPEVGPRLGSVGVNIYRAALGQPSSLAEGAAPVIRAAAAPIAGSPFAGESALDSSASIGERYLYEARLVAVGPGIGLRESLPAERVLVDDADRFPPGPPSLVTIDAPSRDAEPPGRLAVRLAWSSPLDADVSGYRLYRAEGEGAFLLAASVPATQATWLDTAAIPGRSYRYYVTAIDGANPPNESAGSATVETTVPAPPGTVDVPRS